MPSSPLRTISLLGPPLVVMAVIFALSAMPSGSTHHGLVVFVLRKMAHFTEYAVLCAALVRALRAHWSDPAALVGAVVLAVAYAGTDEVHQTFVSGRVGTPHDVLIDASGAIVAALALGRWARRRLRPRGRVGVA